MISFNNLFVTQIIKQTIYATCLFIFSRNSVGESSNEDVFCRLDQILVSCVFLFYLLCKHYYYLF